jgi:hypothetical protein
MVSRGWRERQGGGGWAHNIVSCVAMSILGYRYRRQVSGLACRLLVSILCIFPASSNRVKMPGYWSTQMSVPHLTCPASSIF